MKAVPEDAIAAAGILPDDPLRPILEGFNEAVREVSICAARVELAAESVRNSLTVSGLEAITKEAVAAADRRAVALAREHSRRNAVLVAALLFCSFVGGCSAGLGGGWWSGKYYAETTRDALESAVGQNTAASAAWLRLIRSNGDIVRAEASCLSGKDKATGRRACAVPLWLDPP